MSSDLPPRPTESTPRWRAIPARDRRLLGVLIEKAKTTPDQYPLSMSGLRSGANQKNNRFPLMELEVDDVEESLARLRAAGAVAEVQGGGRVAKYRHYGYEWLGVDKVELAVMAELLLRGAQTEGELRGRAARMEPIADVAALRPILASLIGKSLVISLTPEGRGHVVTHNLYELRELDKVRAEAQAHAGAHATDRDETADAPPARTSTPASSSSAALASPARTAMPAPPAADNQAVAELKQEVSELRDEVARIRKDLEDLWSNFR